MNLFVIMGVSGSGKSSVAQQLATARGGEFLDADDFHPHTNLEKMTAGIPLQDSDRSEWLDLLNSELRLRKEKKQPTFLACSALKKIYRARLSHGLPDLRFIYLQGSRECLSKRLLQRRGHFMKPALLESQFAILEEPSPEEALTISVIPSLPEVVHSILHQIG